MTKRSMSDAARRRFSGATISARRLYIATIEEGHSGSLIRCGVPSGCFTLPDRSQLSTIRFRNEVRAFLRKYEIERLFFRINKSGRFGTFRREVFKIEAVLDLIPGVNLYAVDPNKIGAWLERTLVSIPECSPLKYAPDRNLEQNALDVAAYFASNPVALVAKSTVTVDELEARNSY